MIVSSASPDVRIVSAKSRCSASSSVSRSSPLIPMIAFIGVRISWLIAARNALFAWFASSAAAVASWASANSRAFSIAIDACWESPTRKSRSAWMNGSPPGAPDRHHPGDPVAGDERRDHQALVSGSCSAVPGIVDVRGSRLASLTNSGVRRPDRRRR